MAAERGGVSPVPWVDRIVPAMTGAGLIDKRHSSVCGTRALWQPNLSPVDHRGQICCSGAELVRCRRTTRARYPPYEEVSCACSMPAIQSLQSPVAVRKEIWADVMAEPALARYITELMSDELIPALDAPGIRPDPLPRSIAGAFLQSLPATPLRPDRDRQHRENSPALAQTLQGNPATRACFERWHSGVICP